MKQLAIFEAAPSERAELHSSSDRSRLRREAESPSRPDASSRSVEALLTSREAAEILKIHPKVLERMAKRGEVPALKVGKFWRYSARALDEWIRTRLQSERQPCRMKTSF